MPVYEWSWGERGCCPESDHPKKIHRGNHTARRKETREAKGFRGKSVTVSTYFDTVTCVFCGDKHEQEWMPAGI